MEYAQFGNTFVVRLDKGDEILSSLMQLCEKERVRLAKVTGLGAVGKATIGVANLKEKRFFNKTFEGIYEIASLIGSVTVKDDKPYFHLHIAIGNPETGEFHGGHLTEGVIVTTGEMFIECIDGEVWRETSPERGQNAMTFGK